MGPNNMTKCERNPACTRTSVGTVRLSMNPPGDDTQTCEQHAGGLTIWYFGKRSPYAKTSSSRS